MLKKAQAEKGSFVLLSDSDHDPWRTWKRGEQEGYENCQMSIVAVEDGKIIGDLCPVSADRITKQNW